MAGIFGAAPCLAKATRGVKRVAGAKHRRRAGEYQDLEHSAFAGLGAHHFDSPKPLRLISFCNSEAIFDCPREAQGYRLHLSSSAALLAMRRIQVVHQTLPNVRSKARSEEHTSEFQSR